jgi:dimethylargininase
MARCELTHRARVPIDVGRAAAQHAAYERALVRLGCSVPRLGSGPDMPDSVFVEDAAVVLDEIAVIMRPGAASRRGETTLVADALRPYRSLARIEPPGTMDGGDVLCVGRTIFVGSSTRTNASGVAQMTDLAAPHGYRVRAVKVHGCLHLKSAVTAVSHEVLLVNRDWIASDELEPFELIDVDPAEAAAANVACVGGRLLAAAAFPRTRRRLEQRGFPVTAIDLSEIAKAEGAVTCCSVMFTTHQETASCRSVI